MSAARTEVEPDEHFPCSASPERHFYGQLRAVLVAFRAEVFNIFSTANFGPPSNIVFGCGF